MDFDQVFSTVDTLVFDAEGRHLSEAERVVLSAAWDNVTYEQAAEGVGYSSSYLKRDIGPKLWKRLSQLLQEPIGKKNFKLRFGLSLSSNGGQPVEDFASGASSSSVAVVAPPLRPRQSWGDLALDVSNFLGREAEFEQLKDWIIRDRCRLVNLWGEAGIGKTFLAVKLAQQLQAQFDVVFCCWLSPELTTADLLTQLVNFLANGSSAPLPQTPAEQIDWLLRQFDQQRCLIVLDGVESAFAARQLLGTYRSGCEVYRDFLEAIAVRQHKSCLLWVGREQARLLNTAAVRSHQLTGLKTAEVQALLQNKLSAAAATAWAELRDRYGGNPRHLLVTTLTIDTVFQGQLEQFLRQPLELDDEISRTFAPLFQRLSAAEQRVMYWLAIADEPLSFETLQAISVEDLREQVIRSLLGRSLGVFHRDPERLGQSPLIQLYCLQQFRQQVKSELDQASPRLLNSHALIQAKAKEAIQHKQRRQLLQPLAAHLQQRCPSKQALIEKFGRLLAAMSSSSLGEHHYGAGNLINLCQQLDLPLSAFEWSKLSLRQADFQRLNLHGIDLSQTVLSETVFAKPLSKNPVAAFHPTEPLLATGDDEGRIIVWRLSDGKPQQVFSNVSGAAIHALAFSADGQFLAEGADDQQLRLWNLPQEHPYPFQGVTQVIRCLTFSADDQILASGSDDGAIQLWDVGVGDCLTCLATAAAPITSLCFSPDGDWLMGCSEAQTIHYWNVRTETSHTFRNGTDSWLSTVAFLPAAALEPMAAAQTWRPMAVSCSDRSVLLWQIDADRPWRRFLPEQFETPPAAIALSPDGRYLAYSRQSRQVALWHLPNQTPLAAPPEFEQPVSFLRFSPDGRYLAIGSDYLIQLWDLATAQVLRTLRGSRYPVSSFTGDFNQGLLVSGHRDDSVRVWQVNLYSNHSRCQQVFQHQNWVRTLAFSPDGAWLASGSDDCTIRLWQTANADFAYTLSGHTDPVRALAFDPSSQTLASAGQDGSIRLWQVQTGRFSTQLSGHAAAVYALAFSADGRWLASGGDDQSLHLWYLPHGHAQIIDQAHNRRIHRLCFNAAGTQLLSGSYDQQVKLWQLEPLACLTTWQQPQHRVCEVLFQSADEPRVVSSCDRALAYWSIQAEQPYYSRQAHETAVEQTALSADNQHLISLSTNAELGIWEIASGTQRLALHVDRPYERLNIRDSVGLEPLEKHLLQLLGAVEL
ncbi:WD40 domain-containing protein [Almyronema epifaneia]|uniref:AAA family ATPase n=1 Tax=Almyronema epifaneia S1 TaxID=2991925 RepID=A0ABW6IA86_9CYAN